MARCPSFGYAVLAGPLKRQRTLLASTSRLLVVSVLLSAQCIIASPVACSWGVSLDQAAAALDAGAKSAQCMDLFLTTAPSALLYTVNVLRANAAALEGDGFGWVDSVNTVLAHWVLGRLHVECTRPTPFGDGPAEVHISRSSTRVGRRVQGKASLAGRACQLR